MSNFVSAAKAFIDDENGATAIEYGLIAALIGVVIAAVAAPIGVQLKAKFNTILEALGGTAVS